MTVTKEYLTEIKRVGNELCADIDKLPKNAVNYGDVRCISVEYYIDDEGDSGIRATFSEADPSASKFKKYIYDGFVSRGYNVEVATEW